MIYGSVCSGIEAASLAWEPLGWEPAWFAEVEPFPCAVLAHRWPQVPNLGDMTTIATSVLRGDVMAPDILVGGTPCQAFSVAGARRGLADDRGFLTIKYVELANAIDQKRATVGAVPCITVWENVPGVLSSKDNAFGAFLGFLAGEDCELIPPGKKWENAGCVFGPQRAIAWRVIDAQYFGVAQRRRRVFVVASAREGFDPTEILFEREGLRRDSPPCRETGSVVAALTANGVGTCGADDNQGQAGHLIPQVAGTLQANGKAAGSATQQDAESGMLVVHGTQDPDTNTEIAHTLGRNQGQENAVLTQYGVEVVGTLTARYDSSPCADRGMNVLASTYPILEIGKRTGNSTTDLRAGLGVGADGDPMFTLQAGAQHGVAAFAENSRQEVRLEGGDGRITGALSGGGGKVGQGYPAAIVGMAVRRLTPVECERLQDFPDNHTLIPQGKLNRLIADELAYLRCHFPDMAEEDAHRLAADGPRYKAIGNSMARVCMEWLGRRIGNHLTVIANQGKQEVAA